MYRKFKWAAAMTFTLYFLITVLSLIVKKQIETSLVSKLGFAMSLLLILTRLPMRKFLFYGSRPIAPNWLPPDEHLYHKLERDYNVVHEDKSKHHRRITFLAGILSFGIAYLLHFISD